MYRITIAYHNKIKDGQHPIPYILIHTHLGWYLFSQKYFKKFFEVDGYIADGTYTADGSILAGSGLGLLGSFPRIKDFGQFERSLLPKEASVLTAYYNKQIQNLTITLDNSDLYFSQLIWQEPFLSREIRLYNGFDDIDINDHLCLFRGTISEVNLTSNQLVVTAYES